MALLKHAYLAACMTYGVLEGEVADLIRADLVAARDADGPQNVPTSALALGQRVSRGGEPTPGIPPLVRAVAQEADGPGPGWSWAAGSSSLGTTGFLLAGRPRRNTVS